MLITGIGSDPGDSNYGYAVITYDTEKIKFSIQELGMFTCQINNLTNSYAKPPKSKRRKRKIVADYAPFPEQLDLFEREWIDLIVKYNTRTISTERFQARGLRGKSIEIVSIMNGVIALTAQHFIVPMQMITAATWKNQVNRLFDLKLLYTKLSLTPHTVDAVFIAIDGILKQTNLTWATVSKTAIKDLLFQLKEYEN